MFKKTLLIMVVLAGLIFIFIGNSQKIPLGIIGGKTTSVEENNQFNGYEEICPDFNGGGVVNLEDFFLLKNRFGSREGDKLYKEDFDLDKNGHISFNDLWIFADYFGKKCEMESSKQNLTLMIFLIDSQKYPHPPNLKKEDVYDWFFNESNTKSAYNYIKLMSKDKVTLNGEVYGWYTEEGYGFVDPDAFMEEFKDVYDDLIDFSLYDTNGDGVLDGGDDSRILFLTSRGRTGSGSTNLISKGNMDGILLKKIAWSPGWYDQNKLIKEGPNMLFSIDDFNLRQPLHEVFHLSRSVDGYFQRYPNDYATIPDLYQSAEGGWSFYGKSYMSEDKYRSLYESSVSHMSAAVRELIGWDIPETVDYGISDIYSVKSFYGTFEEGTPTILKIPTFEGYDDKYYLVEFRRREGFDLAIPKSGVFIQYINKFNFRDKSGKCTGERPCKLDQLNGLDLFASSLSPNIFPTNGIQLFEVGQGYRDYVNGIEIIVDRADMNYGSAIISVRYLGVPDDDNLFSCNRQGSATNEDLFACEGFTHEKEDNTFDDCKDYSHPPNQVNLYVNDIKVVGPLVTGGEIKVILEVRCLQNKSHPKVGLFFNDDNEWDKIYEGSCDSSDSLKSFETTLKLPKEPGKYIIRGVESWESVSPCRDSSSDSYYDHDDILIDVKPAN